MMVRATMKAPSTKYNPITPKIVEELRRIVGPAYVIFGDAERMEPYSHDEVPERGYAHMPEAVVRPGSAEEVAAIMKLANRRLFPVTPRGAGSGLSGGAVPVCGGVVMLMDRLNRILEIDRENMMIVVEPGVVTNDINLAVKEFGLFYAGYPMSLETCTIGGNVAENAGGAKAVKYGVTVRYVVGLEVVTPTGEIIELSGKLVKDVTGYNLVPFMVGSEGTLGIFTKIILRLLPLPKVSVDLLALFRTVSDAIAAVPRIITSSGVIPTAVEFMDRIAIQTSCDYLNETLPYQQAGAMLLITVDGNDAAAVEADYEAVGEQCLTAGAIEVYVADNLTTSERIWRVRRNIAEAFKVVSSRQTDEDLVVPIAQVHKLVEGIGRLAEKYGVSIPSYGHAADGNIHTRIVMNPTWSQQQWDQTVPKMLHELYELTASLGGKISGEHGIGHKRKAYMPLFVSPGVLEVMRAIKRALDPRNVLNPSKIFDA
jgi:glycolate oxidase